MKEISRLRRLCDLYELQITGIEKKIIAAKELEEDLKTEISVYRDNIDAITSLLEHIQSSTH